MFGTFISIATKEVKNRLLTSLIATVLI